MTVIFTQILDSLKWSSPIQRRVKEHANDLHVNLGMQHIPSITDYTDFECKYRVPTLYGAMDN